MVERHLTREILARIAAEYRKGRQLLVLTSDLDSQRAVIWNMGAIANSDRPEALKLFQDVIIASASIPGVFPAVLIKAKFQGQEFEEMHSDGGSASAILTVPDGWMVGPGTDDWLAGRKLNMYIIVNNALMPEFSTTTNNVLGVLARAIPRLLRLRHVARLLPVMCMLRRTVSRSAWLQSTDRFPIKRPIRSTLNTCAPCIGLDTREWWMGLFGRTDRFSPQTWPNSGPKDSGGPGGVSRDRSP